jgi:mRNA interferase MazF
MRRGEIWTVAGGRDYAGKPRPVVILQDDRFDATASITICAFTTDPTDAPLFRLLIEPNANNGLRSPCRLMVDKITTVAKSKLGPQIGGLDDADILRLNRAVVVFLGLATGDRQLMRRISAIGCRRQRHPTHHRPRRRRAARHHPLRRPRPELFSLSPPPPAVE